ncbi:MAG: transposase [Elusimicrobia bacterium]|nr:transposase [Cyanobacteria bacterium REEB65]MDE2040685.1 transposase [Elusimicrobiota bacterium]
MGSGYKTFSAQERATIISAIECGLELGKRVGVTAREHGITEAVFYRWIRERSRARASQSVAEWSAPSVRRSRTNYSPEQKAALVSQIRQLREAGVSFKDVAGRLGVHENSCYRWMREMPEAPFRPVEIVTATAPPSLSLVAPSGHRIDGLDVETAAQLLRALG